MATTNRTAEEAKAEHTRVMGQELGPLYAALWQQLAGLHRKWQEYVTLFGTRPSRVELLNRGAGSFFRMVQDTFWDDILLHIARVTDSPKSMGKPNLSMRRLPECIERPEVRAEVEMAIDKMLAATEFSRDWRNRRIAHSDLALALELGAEPLKPASREKVNQALDALDAVLNVVGKHYLNSTSVFDHGTQPGGTMPLLYVIDDGIKAAEARRERQKSGTFQPEDFGPRDL